MNSNIHITNLYHTLSNNNLNINNFCIVSTVGKFDKHIHQAKYNNVKIFKTSHYKIHFECPTCKCPNSLLLSNFLSKLNKNHKHFKCFSCENSVIENINNKDKNLPLKKVDIIPILPYLNIYLHWNDYDYIPKFGSEKKNEPIIRVKYNSEVIKLSNRYATCSNCLDYFFMKKLNYDILCPDCKSVQFTKSKVHNCLTYKTKFELKFIKYCVENNIDIVNSTLYKGFKQIPFYLPQLNMFIDLKSNLCYDYREPIHIINFIQGNYIAIYPKTYVFITRTIKRLCS